LGWGVCLSHSPEVRTTSHVLWKSSSDKLFSDTTQNLSFPSSLGCQRCCATPRYLPSSILVCLLHWDWTCLGNSCHHRIRVRQDDVGGRFPHSKSKERAWPDWNRRGGHDPYCLKVRSLKRFSARLTSMSMRSPPKWTAARRMTMPRPLHSDLECRDDTREMILLT
jgi:hypothetical protein